MVVNQPPRWRVMVDANVLVAGSAWPRWPYEVLQHAANGDYQLVLSIEIIREARVSIAKFDQRYSQLLEAMVAESNYEVACRDR